MDDKQAVRAFLLSRRERIRPEDSGLPLGGGGHRRVKGLRREEVAMLAGVSVDYYTRLERGNLAGVSEQVLDALACALHLDEAERSHLFDLAATANRSSRTARRPVGRSVRPQVQWLLDRMRDAPAYVRNHRTDLLAANALGRALYAPIFAMERPNVARFLFLEPAARGFFVDWDAVAPQSAAMLRGYAGRYPHDQGLHDLVGELSTRSREFAGLWAAHDVRQHTTGTKRFRHHVVGELTLAYEVMELTAEVGLTLTAYSAEPGSRDADALALLASWATAPAGA